MAQALSNQQNFKITGSGLAVKSTNTASLHAQSQWVYQPWLRPDNLTCLIAADLLLANSPHTLHSLKIFQKGTNYTCLCS